MDETNDVPNSVQDRSSKVLDENIFFVISALLLFLCLLLVFNLYCQWNNYEQGISAAMSATPIRHELILLYSRSMDFAFAKTVTITTGFLLVFVGALYLLRLTLVSYSLGISNPSGAVNIQTSSPGLVLVTLGVATILFSSYQKSLIEFSTASQPFAQLYSVLPDTAEGFQNPNPSVTEGVIHSSVTSNSSNQNSFSSSSIAKLEKMEFGSLTNGEKLSNTLSSIKFQSGHYELTSESYSFIKGLCAYMLDGKVTKSDINRIIETDLGSDRHQGMAIRERRVDNFRQIIQRDCVGRITTKLTSYGEEPPKITP